MSNKPIPAAAMTPTPPSFATAAANPDIEIPTPIPPCMIGSLIVRFPMCNSFISKYRCAKLLNYLRLDVVLFLCLCPKQEIIIQRINQIEITTINCSVQLDNGVSEGFRKLIIHFWSLSCILQLFRLLNYVTYVFLPCRYFWR